MSALQINRSPALSHFKIWNHSIAPPPQHIECYHRHHLLYTPIPMGDASFLLQHPRTSHISPQTVVGSIYALNCPSKGTTIRVEILNKTFDVLCERVVGHLQVLTGPVINGYRVIVMFRGEENCHALVFALSINREKDFEIQCHVHELVNNVECESERPFKHMGNDGGMGMSRHSWVNSQIIYEEAARIVSTYVSYEPFNHSARRMWENTLTDLHSPAKRYKMSSLADVSMPCSFKQVRESTIMVFTHNQVVQDMMKKVEKLLTDCPWMGGPYLTMPHRI